MINQILEKKSIDILDEYWSIIYRISKKGNVYIRRDVAEMLGVFQNDRVIDLLIEMKDDKDSIVRMEVVSSLCKILIDEKVYNALLEMSNDSNRIVRAYAIEGMAWMHYNSEFSMKTSVEEFENYLLEKLKCYQGLYSQVAIYFSLIIVGNDEYIEQIFDIYKKTRFYITKINILNGIDAIYCDSISDSIEKFIIEIENVEYPISIKEVIDRIKAKF